MKAFCTTIFAVFMLTVYAPAQNLVPNPSFEEYSVCPDGTAGVIYSLENWVRWSATPDFFHACANNINNGISGMPENAWGNQPALTDSGYAALVTSSSLQEDGREYMAAELTEPLQSGEQYYLLMHASLCDGGIESNYHCASNHIGMRFFKDPDYNVDFNNELEPDNFAHLDYDEVLTDSLNWTVIEGSFTADDDYNWIALGNFFDDSNTDTLHLDNPNNCNSFYYIENICVSTDPVDCQNLLSTGNEQKLDIGIDVYPNPAHHRLTVRVERSVFNRLEIWDARGRLLLGRNYAQSSKASINLSILSKGVYLLSIRSTNQTFHRKIIVQ